MFATGTLAADAAPRLLSLVGSDVGLCVELRDARGEWARIGSSEWRKRVEATRLFQDWSRGDDARKLKKSIEAFEKTVDQPADKLLAALFGQQAVLAVYPRAKADPVAVLLTHAESADALDRIVRLWNKAESAVLSQKTHAGKPYFVRSDPRRPDRPSATTYYGTDGPLLVLSDREELVRDVLERLASQTADAPLRDAPRTIDSFRAWPSASHSTDMATAPADAAASGGAPSRVPLVRESVVRGLIQPQVWRRAAGNADETPFPAWAGSWHTCESIAWEVRFDEGWRVDLRAVFPVDSASPQWRAFVERSGGPLQSQDAIPANAFAVFGGRLDLSQSAALLDQAIAPDQKKNWTRARQVARGLLSGRDLPTEVLPALGPDMLIWIAPAPPPDAEVKAEVEADEKQTKKPSNEGTSDRSEDEDGANRPADQVRAVRSLPWEAAALIALSERAAANATGPDSGVPARNRRSKVTVAAAIDNALSTGMNLLAAGLNGNDDATAIVLSEPPSETLPTTLRWIEGLPLVTPAFAAAEGQIILATDPRVVRRHFAHSAKPAAASSKVEKAAAAKTNDASAPPALSGRLIPRATQFAHVDVAAVRQSLIEQAAPLVKRLARARSKSDEEGTQAARTIGDVADLLTILDEADLALRVEAAELRLSAAARLRR